MGLSQRDVAKACGRSQATVSGWESGRNLPAIPLLAALGDHYGLTDAELGRLIRDLTLPPAEVVAGGLAADPPNRRRRASVGGGLPLPFGGRDAERSGGEPRRT